MKPTVLIYSLSILFFSSCKQNDSVAVADAAYADSTAVEAADLAVASYKSEDKADMVQEVAMYAPPKVKDYALETKIIKTGSLRFQTDDLDKTYSQIQAVVKKYKAQIKNDTQSNGDYQMSRSVNIRIPNEHFDAFVADVSKGVTYFDQKEISSEDVTEEYIDVASRIKTKKILEQRYLELLKKANKVSEMLEIEGQLSEIREEIEAKEGRLRYLENQVAMSTLDITFYKPVAQGQKATVSYGGRIGNALKSGFNGISNFFIGLIENWPLIITLVALIIFIRRRFKRKNK